MSLLRIKLAPRKKRPRLTYRLGAILLITCLFWGGAGQAATAVVDVSAILPDAAAQLTISPSSINFPDADPDSVPSIPAKENPVMVTISAQTAGNKTVTLTVLAHDDLLSGSNRIPISNVRWTHTGDVFLDGTMSKTVPQTAASWRPSWFGAPAGRPWPWTRAAGRWAWPITPCDSAPWDSNSPCPRAWGT
jgi:hypothetical protein